MFESSLLYDSDIATASQAVIHGSEPILLRCLQNAELGAKLTMLNKLSSQALELRIVRAKMNNLQVLLKSIGKLSDNEILVMEDLIQRTLISALIYGNSDVLADFSTLVLPAGGLSEQNLIQLLTIACKRSHISDIEAILTIPMKWTVRSGYKALLGAIILDGPEQLQIVETLVAHFDSLGLVEGVINNSPSGCKASCVVQHGHDFPTSLFATAIMAGHYNVAELIAPYLDHDSGYPTALYHILSSPGRNVQGHIDFLLNLGPEHRRYICYPQYNRSVLQVVAMRNGMYFLAF